MLVHRRSSPRNLLGFPNNLPVPIYTPGWREALWELSVLPNNTTQCPRPGLEPGPLAPGTSALTMRPRRQKLQLLYTNKECKILFMRIKFLKPGHHLTWGYPFTFYLPLSLSQMPAEFVQTLIFSLSMKHTCLRHYVHACLVHFTRDTTDYWRNLTCRWWPLQAWGKTPKMGQLPAGTSPIWLLTRLFHMQPWKGCEAKRKKYSEHRAL